MTNVTDSDFSGQGETLENEAFEELVQKLAALKNTQITCISLDWNNLGSKSGAELAQMLAALKDTQVIRMYLSWNNLGSKSGAELAQMLAALEDTQVTTINLSANDLGSRSGAELAQMLAALKGTKVARICLSGNGLGNKTIAELAQMFAALKGTKVTTIDLSGYGLADKRGEKLTHILAALKDTQITKIDLSANKFGNVELKQMFAALKGTKVTTINLFWSLEKENEAELVEILAVLKDTQITKIDLSVNELRLKSPAELQQIVDAIPNVFIQGIDSPVVDAHNLLVQIRNKVTKNEIFYVDDLEVPEKYGKDNASLEELMKILIDKYDSLGLFTCGLLKSGGMIDFSATEQEYIDSLAQGINFYLQSTKDPSLIPIILTKLAQTLEHNREFLTMETDDTGTNKTKKEFLEYLTKICGTADAKILIQSRGEFGPPDYKKYGTYAVEKLTDIPDFKTAQAQLSTEGSKRRPSR